MSPSAIGIDPGRAGLKRLRRGPTGPVPWPDAEAGALRTPAALAPPEPARLEALLDRVRRQLGGSGELAVGLAAPGRPEDLAPWEAALGRVVGGRGRGLVLPAPVAVAVALLPGEAPPDGARHAVLDLGHGGVRLSLVVWRRVGDATYPHLEASEEVLELGGARLDADLAAVARWVGRPGDVPSPGAAGFAELKELMEVSRGPFARPVRPAGAAAPAVVEVGARAAREVLAAFVRGFADALPAVTARVRAARPDRVLLAGGLLHLSRVRAAVEEALAGEEVEVVVAPRPLFAAGEGALRALERPVVPRAPAALSLVVRRGSALGAREVVPAGAPLPGRFGPLRVTARPGLATPRATLLASDGELLEARLPHPGGLLSLAWSFASGWTCALEGGAPARLERADPARADAVRGALDLEWGARGRPVPLDLVLVFRATRGGGPSVRAAVEEAAAAMAGATAGGDVRLRGLAVGDHPQGHLTPDFVTRLQPAWSADPAELQAFVAGCLAAPTEGVDAPEAYECALREAADLDWRAGARRQLVVVADAPPHTPDAPPYCPVDWRAEAERLGAAGVELLPVHLLAPGVPPALRRETRAFLEGLGQVRELRAGAAPPELLAEVAAAAAQRELDAEARAALDAVDLADTPEA